MQIVIDISEELYRRMLDRSTNLIFNSENAFIGSAIKKGKPLPKGHGDLIDRKLVLSDDGLCEFHRYDDYVKMRNYLKSIPTIIKSDNGESEEE